MLKKNILVLTSTFPRWLDDTDPPFIYFLCRGLTAYNVHVLAPHYAGCATEEVFDGIQVHRYRYAPSNWQVLAYDGGLLRKIKKNPFSILLLPSFLFCQWLAAWRLGKQHDIDLLHAHWIIPQGLIAAMIPCKFLLTSHGGDLYALNSPMLRMLKRWILRKASHITVVSNAMTVQCAKLGVPAAKMKVCSMGVDTQRSFVPFTGGAGSSRHGLLCVGRLVEKKGISFLIHAMELLKRQNILIPLNIIGDGPERSSLKALVVEKGLDNLVTFVGAIRNPELPRYYQQAQIFILPSIVSRDGDQEGLGLVSVEAMACGCPVVASDLPAVRDVITHDVDGLLIPPASAEALANAIGMLAGNIELRTRLSIAGIERARFFDWQKICQNYSETIGRVIADQDLPE